MPEPAWPTCSGVGSWNPVYERCVCPIGRSGRSCEVAALQACRLRNNSTVVSCQVRRPLHCECISQCVASGAFEAHLYPICFTRELSRNLSDLPSHRLAATASAVQFFRWREKRRVEVQAALQHEFQPRLRHVPHRNCPQRCSERGACLASDDVRPFCQCDSHRLGRACERSSSPTCYNDCSGRGTCVDGFCRCRPPHFGPGCAYTSTMTGAAATGGRGHPSSGLRIHVYDFDHIVLSRVSYGSDPDPIFNTYHTFTAMLLADPSRLTPSPEDADLLLVPAYGTNMERLMEYYEHAQRSVARLFPRAWRRHRGRDHVWFTTGDGGGCDLNRLPATRNGIILAHYLKLNKTTQAAGGSGSSQVCGGLGKDIALPPHVPPVAAEAFLASGLTPMSQRRLAFFFAGNVPDKHLVDSAADDALAAEAYSEGVRQLVWKHHRLRSGFRVVERSPTYAADWARARFCLAPLGVGWGVRLLWAIEGGCVPVLASSEVSPYFDDAIDYSAFALHGVDKKALPRLHEVLASVPTRRQEQLQASVLAHRRLFLWHGGLAYNVTLSELCWRARYRRPGVRCDELLPAEARRLVIPPQRRRGSGGEGGASTGTTAARRAWWRRSTE